MRPPSIFSVGTALGLVSNAFAAPGFLQETCPDGGIQVVEVQPYKVIYNGQTSTTVVTRTYTQYAGSTGAPNSNGAGSSPPSKSPGNSGQPGGSESDCDGCVTVTTTASVTFRTTIPPDTLGGVSTVIAGYPPPVCHECITVTTTGPIAYVTTVPPAASGGKSTVITCNRPETVTVTPPVCHECITVTTTGSTAYVTTIPPASSGGKSTVVTCNGPTTVIVTPTVTITGNVTEPTTILQSTGTLPCTATVIVPHRVYTTLTTEGPIPGTKTLPFPSDCGESCTATVIVTEVINHTTLTTTGPVGGTTTLSVPSGCFTCTETVIITNTPGSTHWVTVTTTGPIAGTTTLPVPSGCLTCTETGLLQVQLPCLYPQIALPALKQ
ncbi:hypothetical protein FANTH_13779 [Fusarium anthophilum]|uniref:Uncharacterized protein n=1 Tax=Fusarium anthophilum TaxID=48485 RepID=A0A8H4YLY0_9HYPO|nr:hypothetical protein FANTH_13779 [Fusarium anthophilum]